MKTYDFLMKSAKSKNPQERQAFAKLPIATSPNLGPKLKKHFMDLQAEILGKTSGSLLAKSDILGTHEGFFNFQLMAMREPGLHCKMKSIPWFCKKKKICERRETLER